MLRNVESGCLSERQLRKLEKMRQDGKTPLYKNCPMSKLEADIMLFEFKSTNGLSNKGFDQLLGIIRKMLLEKTSCQKRHTWPSKWPAPSASRLKKIHACSNDYILYCGDEYKDLDACPKCEVPRYKEGPSEEGTKTRGGPINVVWYFPIAPQLHRLFACAKSAKLLCWHGEERKKDTMIRHPTNGKD
jgi:hypothetical protein